MWLKYQATNNNRNNEEMLEEENMQSEYSGLSYRADFYFHECKLAIDVDEYGHDEGNIGYEKKDKKAIEEKPGCKFVIINPDEQNVNIFKA